MIFSVCATVNMVVGIIEGVTIKGVYYIALACLCTVVGLSLELRMRHEEWKKTQVSSLHGEE